MQIVDTNLLPNLLANFDNDNPDMDKYFTIIQNAFITSINLNLNEFYKKNEPEFKLACVDLPDLQQLLYLRIYKYLPQIHARLGLDVKSKLSRCYFWQLVENSLCAIKDKVCKIKALEFQEYVRDFIRYNVQHTNYVYPDIKFNDLTMDDLTDLYTQAKEPTIDEIMSMSLSDGEKIKIFRSIYEMTYREIGAIFKMSKQAIYKKYKKYLSV